MDCGFCKDKKWFRYRAGAIILEDGQILLAKNDDNDFYYTVGGGVQVGETAKEAVLRETLEETGVQYEIERLIFVHENLYVGQGSMEGLDCHEICFFFLMKHRGTRQICDLDGVTNEGFKEHMVWIPLNELDKYTVYPSFIKDKLQHMKNEIKHIVTVNI